ncbi:MAG: c-type cytochrome [Phycisphaerales bacterium JB043]
MSTLARTFLMGASVALVALAGCRGDRSSEAPRQFFPGLDDQPRYDPQEESEFFANGRVVQDPVANTVAFGRFSRQDPSRVDFLRDSDALYRGQNGSGNWIDRAPIGELTGADVGVADLIELGRQQFNIYCIVCHGGVGVGGQGTQYAGLVGDRWSYPIPNLHDAQYQRGGEKGQDGYLFNVVRNGVPNEPGIMPEFRMRGYSQQVNEREAWAIVLYLRTLQRSRNSTLADVPEAMRGSLTSSQEVSQ